MRRLYYAFPFEVVSTILDFLLIDDPESNESGDMQETDCVPENVLISNSDMKTVLLKLAEKEPRFLLSALKSVIEMIEAEENPKNKGTSYSLFWELYFP
jgi:ribosomal biogenesis protein LAS1